MLARQIDFGRANCRQTAIYFSIRANPRQFSNPYFEPVIVNVSTLSAGITASRLPVAAATPVPPAAPAPAPIAAPLPPPIKPPIKAPPAAPPPILATLLLVWLLPWRLTREL